MTAREACGTCGEVLILCECEPEEQQPISPYDRKTGSIADRAIPLVAELELLEVDEAHAHVAYDALCELPPAAWPALAQLAAAVGLQRCQPIQAFNALCDTYAVRRQQLEARARAQRVDIYAERARLKRLDALIADNDLEADVAAIENQHQQPQEG